MPFDDDEIDVGDGGGVDGSRADWRACPVCMYRHEADRPEGVIFETFRLMLAHWERCHPKADPSLTGGSSNAREYILRNAGELRELAEAEDVEAWAQDLEDHPQELVNTWLALGYVVTT